MTMGKNVRHAHGIGRFIFRREKFHHDNNVCSSFCLGCPFESNNKEFNYTDGNLAIEWESSAYYLRYLSNREQVKDKNSNSFQSNICLLLGC